MASRSGVSIASIRSTAGSRPEGSEDETAPTLAALAAPEGGAVGSSGRPFGTDETAPTLAMLAEGRLCTAGPCRGRGAVLREFPATPPGGGASLPWGGPAGG